MLIATLTILATTREITADEIERRGCIICKLGCDEDPEDGEEGGCSEVCGEAGCYDDDNNLILYDDEVCRCSMCLAFCWEVKGNTECDRCKTCPGHGDYMADFAEFKVLEQQHCTCSQCETHCESSDNSPLCLELEPTCNEACYGGQFW